MDTELHILPLRLTAWRKNTDYPGRKKGEKMGEKILYLECYSGISGDMTVGALLDLGASREHLERAIKSLGIDGYRLSFGRKKKCGIDAYDFDVVLTDTHHEVHAHGEHVHEEHVHKEHVHEEHVHGEHVHEGHVHGEHEHCHPHIHRNIRDIFALIDRLDEKEEVRRMARKIFTIVAEAESKAHGIPVEEVHFHEVGAVDSIIDIIGVAVCLSDLGIDRVAVSPLAEGTGYVRCQHGVMPVPVPATANIAAAHGLELKITDNDGEMVTPTGAAIAAALRTEKKLPENCRIEKIGTGAGNKDFKNANILRAMIVSAKEDAWEEKNMWVLEANIDDSPGEALGLAMEILMERGAKDVWYTPAYMKKNRPAYVLHVLCREEERETLEKTVFEATTTIGIRRYQVSRTVLPRRIYSVDTRYGKADVKCCRLGDEIRCYPEFESVRAVCSENGIGFFDAYQAICEGAQISRGKETAGEEK